jgi:hypothetical protein
MEVRSCTHFSAEGGTLAGSGIKIVKESSAHGTHGIHGKLKGRRDGEGELE